MEMDQLRLSLYRIEGLSFSYFISNLLETVRKVALGHNDLPFYPEEKEIRKIKDFYAVRKLNSSEPSRIGGRC